MEKYVYFLILLLNTHHTISDTLHPKYSENFKCLDGSKIIPSTQINDDYCDCTDGSDETNTSACPNSQFICINHGYRPKTIPSSRVNDGICDCCDSSDEYATDSNCQNTCLILSEEERKLRENQKVLIEEGAALRAELINKGKQLKNDRAIRLSELQQSKLEKELIKAEKEEIKRQSEAAEAEALEAYKQEENEKPSLKEEESENHNLLEAQQAFDRYDVNKDGLIEVEELQSDMSLDKNRDGVVTDEEAKFFLNELDRINIDDFVTMSWPLVKPYLMLSQGIFKPPSTEGNKEENDDLDPDKLENMENTEGFEGDDEIGEEGDVEDIEVEEKENSIHHEYDPQTKSIVDLANQARQAVSEIEQEIREIENQIKDIEDQNTKDYGPMEEYATLNGECFKYEDREYIYKLCPFDRASQQPLNGGSETLLGRWDQWSGPDYNKYLQMKYINGVSCWNGPQRSTTVQLKCSPEQKITSVTEPNRCEYVFVFETPANCRDSYNDHYQGHDEL